MRISLVIPTLNRPELLERLLNTVMEQTRAADEIVIVDQSSDGRTAQLTQRFAELLPIKLQRAEARGTSAAKNLGLSKVSGDIVAFPDDDCWYPPDLLERIAGHFSSSSEVSVITGKSKNEHDVDSQGRWASSTKTIDRFNIWSTQTQYTTFYRKRVFDTVNPFNEELGTGSGTRWGSGEETELLLRILNAGHRCYYDPTIVVYHPEPLAIFDQRAFARCRSYNLGFGRVLRLARYDLWFGLYLCLRPIVGGLISLIRLRLGKSKYQFLSSYYRLAGWYY